MDYEKDERGALGDLLRYFVNILAENKRLKADWNKEDTIAYLSERINYAPPTIYRWLQGKPLPPDNVIETLLRIGKEEAFLPREWGRNVLKAADPGVQPSVVEAILDSVWGKQVMKHILNNLPHPEHARFIGRRKELDQLFRYLTPEVATHILGIEGIGGVGKTALVLEAAHRCLRASTGEDPNQVVPVFEAIVFTSAKDMRLLPGGIVSRTARHKDLSSIFREIARTISLTLERPDIEYAQPDAQRERVLDALRQQKRTLLIIDNLESIEPLERDLILDFLYDLPVGVKAIITSRETIHFTPIKLLSLPRPEGLELIRQEAAQKQISMSEEDIRSLYEQTGGVPLAMIYAVGALKSGYSIERVLEQLTKKHGDVARYCFAQSIDALTEMARRVLTTLAIFPDHALTEAIAAVADYPPYESRSALKELEHFSLVNPQDGERSYSMLPLTREYALELLEGDNGFKHDAYERWVGYYQGFVNENGGFDWGQWQPKYDKLEREWRNLLDVLDWCEANQKYETIRDLWMLLDDFAHIYGLWTDRLYWMEWLVEKVKALGLDWPTAVSSMCSAAWLLILNGQPEEIKKAERLLREAQDLFEAKGVTNMLRARVFSHLAFLFTRKNDYSRATEALDRSDTALTRESGKNDEHRRRAIANEYLRGEILFRSGEIGRAEQIFRKVETGSFDCGWDRMINYSQNWLADCAIERRDRDRARMLLEQGLRSAEANKDRRRIALYKRSYARWEHRYGNLDKAEIRAQEALREFERLGMRPEAEEMRELLRNIGYGSDHE